MSKSEIPLFIENTNLRKEGLGLFQVLSDSLIDRIFKRFLNEKDLLVCALVSYAFYVYASDEETWKKICLKKKGGNFRFKGTWKRSTILDRNEEGRSFEYKTLPLKGFWSSKIYKRWYRSHVSLDPWKSLPFQNIDRRNNLSLKEFKEEYEKKKKPVIITDIVKNWDAYKKWTKENLLERFGNEEFKTDEVNPHGPVRFTKLSMKI